MTTAPTKEPTPPLGRGFWQLLTASGFANFGDGLMFIGITWLASSLTRDPTKLALLGLCSQVPWLLFSLFAGVITDRVDRRKLVGSMDILRALVVAIFAMVIYANASTLPTPQMLADGAAAPSHALALFLGLALVALTLGFAEVLRDNAAQTLLPSVVDKRNLERANGFHMGVEMGLNSFIGPPLGGLLIAASFVLPFATNATLLLLSAVLVFTVPGSFKPERAPTTQAQPRASWKADLREGLTWLWRHRFLRSLAICLGCLNGLGSLAAATSVLFMQEILGLFDGWKFGLMASSWAVGGIIGSLSSSKAGKILPPGATLLTVMIFEAVGFFIAGSTSWPLVFWTTGLLSGFLGTWWNVITVSLRQRIIPDELLGRVNSVYRFFGWGTMSIGALLGGVLVSGMQPLVGREWALRSAFFVAGLGILAATVYASTRLRTSQIIEAKRAAGVED